MLLNFEKMDFILTDVFENHLRYSNGKVLGKIKRGFP